MAADVDIANAALIKLGADRIGSLAENNDRARALNARYNAVRKAELRRHHWRFSLQRTSLPALSAAPAFGYQRQFQVPTGFLKLIQLGEYDVGLDLSDSRNAPTGLYSLEGDQILTDLPAPLKIRFVFDVEDVSLMDDAFKEAFASRLAYECSNRITDDTGKKGEALTDYGMAIKEAKRAQAIEAAQEYPTDDSWVAVRSQ